MVDAKRGLNPGEREVVQRLRGFATRVRDALPHQQPPFFGHLRVQTSGRIRDVLIASGTHVREPLVVVDWKRAPLAEVFFSLGPGEEYEIEAHRRTLVGVVLERQLVTFDGAELVAISTEDTELFLEDGQWWARPAELAARLTSRAKRTRSAPTLVELDPVQREAVEARGGLATLVTGDAGYGKTTVALHRLAHLRALAKDAEHRFCGLVLVPTEGLRRLTVQMLGRLGVHDVEVTVFVDWLRTQGRRVFADVPVRDGEQVSPLVARLKRHRAIRQAALHVAHGTAAMRSLGESEPQGPARRRDLLHLFGDRSLLQAVVDADPELPRRCLDETLAHTRLQFSETTEQQFADVSESRLRTVDGRRIDDATPWRNADSIDAEDFAVLFEINRLRTGGDSTDAGRLQTYDHVVVDEAQEFSLLELSMVGRSVREGGTLTVAGDDKQQVDDSLTFAGWSEAMTELGAGEHARIELRASYRCPPAVERLARGLFSLPEGKKAAKPQPNEVPVVWTRYPTPVHRTMGLIESLVDLRDRDMQAAIAIVCRHSQSAVRLHRELSMGLDARLALDGQFRFSPGVSVTCVNEVKGLEFDVVVIPDASPSSYPGELRCRKALYVAATRATHQLWMVTSGSWSPLLTPALLKSATEDRGRPAARPGGDRRVRGSQARP